MKRFGKLIAVLLVIVMAFGMSGFKDVTDEISDVSGMYRGEVDVRDLLVDAMAAMKDMGADPETHFKEAIFDIYLELTEDGDYHLFVDLAYGMSQIRQSMYSMMKELVENSMGSTVTDEQLDAVLGEGWLDTLMASFEEGFDEGAGGDISEEGTYTMSGNKITFDGADTLEFKNDCLTVDMGDPFGEVVLKPVEVPVIISNDLFLMDPSLFGSSYGEIIENTDFRVTELIEQDTNEERCKAFFGGIDVVLCFLNGKLAAAWHEEESDEVDQDAVAAADAMMDRSEDGEFIWKFSLEDQKEFPETRDVLLTMWAEEGKDGASGTFTQCWASLDYQE